MNRSDDIDRKSLVHALKQDPDEFLTEHRADLEELRDEVESERLVDTIDAILAHLDSNGGHP